MTAPLDAPVVTIISPTSDHNYYNRNSSPQPLNSSQVFEVIQVSDEIQENTNKRKNPKIEVKKEDEDSNDEGMRGAEALLNLASSNSNKKQTTQTHDRPIILKKCKKE